MPISDLLASISGEKPAPSPTTDSRPGPTIPKRKAGEDLGGAPAKAPRTESLSGGSTRPGTSSLNPPPRPADRTAGSLVKNPASAPEGSARQSSGSQRLNSVSSKDGVRSSSTAAAGKSLSSRPLVNRSISTGSGAKAEPKKRSFAEIMARAEANTAVRESFGKIQHKAITKSLTMKERKELKAEEARRAKKSARQQASGKFSGTAAPPRGGLNRPGKATGAPLKATSAREKTSPGTEEKKVKKAALATTGYTGTARPKPGAAAPKAGASSRPSQSQPRDRQRYGGPLAKPRRYDDYDDELDDFIEYDDEEEEPGYGGRRAEYDSAEDDSDMEAGISDIDEEERRTELLARREDIEEKALEQRLKREKEEKRRKLLAAVRNKAAAR